MMLYFSYTFTQVGLYPQTLPPGASIFDTVFLPGTSQEVRRYAVTGGDGRGIPTGWEMVFGTVHETPPGDQINFQLEDGCRTGPGPPKLMQLPRWVY